MKKKNDMIESGAVVTKNIDFADKCDVSLKIVGTFDCLVNEEAVCGQEYKDNSLSK